LNLQRAYIRDNWKLIVYPQAKVTRLFDLKNDPLELKDLAADPANQSVIADMKAALAAEEQRLGK
jgi:choline-sulfatase